MRISILPAVVALSVPFCLAQTPAEDSLITVVEHSWQRVHKKGKKPDVDVGGPARTMTPSDKNFGRNAREQGPKGTVDPYEYTVEGRSAALERSVQDSRTRKPDNSIGYSYLAQVKNDAERTIEVVYWEYRFAEMADPSNVVRRQFLCAAKIKPGEKRELSAFSSLGPSDVISAESLANSAGKLFDEKVLINRIEYSDGAILQRRDWRYDELRRSVERVTATPWGKEICRGI